MFQGLFDLRSPHDLLLKLRREYSRLEQSPLDQDTAFNFFVTAEHMRDWLHPGYANKDKREELRTGNMLLQICEHIANGSKHFVAEAKRHTSVANTTHEGGAFQSGAFQSDAFDIPRLVIHLKEDAEKQLGSAIEVLDLANRVLAFWENHLSPAPQSQNI